MQKVIVTREDDMHAKMSHARAAECAIQKVCKNKNGEYATIRYERMCVCACKKGKIKMLQKGTERWNGVQAE